MTAATTRRALLGALFLIALGGLLLHLRVHPVLVPDKEHAGESLFRAHFVAATLLPLLDLVVVTALLARRSTAALGYMINGVIVIYGTVLMAHFSIAALAPKDPSLVDWIFRSTLADIAIAWGDFLVGKALFESWMREV